LEKKKLSDLEWEVLKYIWQIQKFPVTVRQVVDFAYPKGEKAYTTVQTVMNNLVKKGFLEIRKMGIVNVYSPKEEMKNLQQNEMTKFVKKVFNGSFFNLASFLLSSGQLTPEEVNKLKKLLEQKSEK